MKTKKIVLTVLALSFCLFLLASCGGGTGDEVKTSGHITALTAPSSAIAEAVRGGADFSHAQFITSADPDADMVLMFSYGIEEDDQLEAIEDYALSTITSNEDPRIFAVIRCKDGTPAETVSAIGEAMKTYADYVIDKMAHYNGEKLALAQAYTVKEYQNGVILTIYDEEGNDAVLSLIDGTAN